MAIEKKVVFDKKVEVHRIPVDPSKIPKRQRLYTSRPAGRAVSGLTSEMLSQNRLAAAEARRRAVELADGEGLLAPLPSWCYAPGEGDEDVEKWSGAVVDKNEMRAYPILWEGASALIFADNADGYASYGRLQPDLSVLTVPRVDAIRRFDVLWDLFHHLGNV
ncbi:MAG: hypothetical protein GY772_14130, partial [bacterium]|nr:hypothetical protein [bacterium]